MASPSRDTIWQKLTHYPPPVPKGTVVMHPSKTVKQFFRDAHRAQMLARQNKESTAILVKAIQKDGEEISAQSDFLTQNIQSLRKMLALTRLNLVEKINPKIVNDCRSAFEGDLNSFLDTLNPYSQDYEGHAALSSVVGEKNARKCTGLASLLLKDVGEVGATSPINSNYSVNTAANMGTLPSFL